MFSPIKKHINTQNMQTGYRKKFTDNMIRITSDLEKKDLTFEEALGYWRYIGQSKTDYLEARLKMYGIDQPQHDFICICTKNLADPHYLYHSDTKVILTIGSTCIKRYFGSNSLFTCIECETPITPKESKFLKCYTCKNRKSPEELLRILQDRTQSQFDTKFNGGKHRGKTFKQVYDIDKGYISWCYRNDKMGVKDIMNMLKKINDRKKVIEDKIKNKVLVNNDDIDIQIDNEIHKEIMNA